MMTRNSRRGLLAVSMVAGVMLVLSSAAFACTFWRGKMVVTEPGGSKVTVVGGNSSLGMVYCLPPDGVVQVNTSPTNWGTTFPWTSTGGLPSPGNPPAPGLTPDGGLIMGKINIKVSESADCGPGNRLPGHAVVPYVVTWLPDGSDCMITAGGIEIGAMNVDPADGEGETDVHIVPPVANTGNNLRPTPFRGKAIVCVGLPGSAISNQAPITIV